MESKKHGFDLKAVRTGFETVKQQLTKKDIITTILIMCMFAFYTLTFFVPRFYGLTEKYVGLFVFVVLFLISAVNINPIQKIKAKDRYFIALVLLAVISFVNILLVDSGFGCFFVMVNFALIWYLSGELTLHKWQLYFIGGMYTAMLIYWFSAVYTWMFADYESFAMNTNTAATFTVFSMLCVFVFFDALYEKHKLVGLLITIALVKCFQLSLYHRSRGAFIMLTVFFVLRFIVPKKLWEKKGFYYTVCVLSTLGSFAFVAFYIWLGTRGVNFRMPFFYKEIFSGREAIWLEFWNLFKAKPLTGIGTNVTITSFFEFNVHNAMYNILVIHGIPVLLLMLYIMFGRWKKCQNGISTRRVCACALAAVLAVCFESYFDVDLMWTNYSLNVFFLLLAMEESVE